MWKLRVIEPSGDEWGTMVEDDFSGQVSPQLPATFTEAFANCTNTMVGTGPRNNHLPAVQWNSHNNRLSESGCPQFYGGSGGTRAHTFLLSFFYFSIRSSFLIFFVGGL